MKEYLSLCIIKIINVRIKTDNERNRSLKPKIIKDNNAGFAIVEAVIVIVIIAAVVAIGFHVVHHKTTTSSSNSANSPNSSTANQSTTSAAASSGTAASVAQLTQQDAQTEKGVDNSADGQTQQNVTSVNSAQSSVGGAYNASSL